MEGTKWSYNGPVTYFGRYICDWAGETFAPSESKAKSNLVFQCKKSMNVAVSAGGVNLPGKISPVNVRRA